MSEANYALSLDCHGSQFLLTIFGVEVRELQIAAESEGQVIPAEPNLSRLFGQRNLK